MQLKRLDTNETLVLPDSLYEQDEFNWSALRSHTQRSIQGALIVQQNLVTKGKPITLSSPPDMAWVTRTLVSQLKTWANVKALVLELASANTRKVMFDTTKEPIEAKPVEDCHSPNPNDPFLITLHFIEID